MLPHTPTNSLFLADGLSFDAQTASGSPLPESADAFSGNFADILGATTEGESRFHSSDGDNFPPTGNELPLLPNNVSPPTQLETPPTDLDFALSNFLESSKQEPSALTLDEYLDGLSSLAGTSKQSIVDQISIVESFSAAHAGVMDEAKASSPAGTVLPTVTPPTTASTSPTPTPVLAQVLVPVSPVTEPAPVSALPLRSDLVGLANSAVSKEFHASDRSRTVRESGESTKPLPPTVDAFAGRRESEIALAASVSNQKIGVQNPATRGLDVFRGPQQESEDIDLELPSLRGEGKSVANIEDAGKAMRLSVQALLRGMPANSNLPGPISIEATSMIDAGVRMAGDTTLFVPRQSTSATSLVSTTYSIDSQVQEPGWDRAISERLLLMANGKLQNADIRLTPAELGPLRVRLAIDDGTANVAFQSQHAVTREAIELALPRLREMFAENGLSLGHTEVSEEGVQHGSREDTTHAGPEKSQLAEDAEVDPELERRERTRLDDGLVDTFA